MIVTWSNASRVYGVHFGLNSRVDFRSRLGFKGLLSGGVSFEEK